MNKEKYNPGDKVRVKGDLGIDVVWNWVDEMFEDVLEEWQYYKCVSELYNTMVGKIYKATNGRVYVEENSTYVIPSMQFSPSTKEAFESQNIPDPNGHPDKDKHNIKVWDVGSYIVVVNPLFRSGVYTKGKIYQIYANDGLAWIKDDADIGVNLINRYITSGGIKWFATLYEAKEYAKSIQPKEWDKDTYLVLKEHCKFNTDNMNIGDVCKIIKSESFENLKQITIDKYPDWFHKDSKLGKCFKAFKTLSEAEAYSKIIKPLNVFNLGDYELTVEDHNVLIGCTTLDKQRVLHFLADFIAFSEEFEDENNSYVEIRGVAFGTETAKSLIDFINEN